MKVEIISNHALQSMCFTSSVKGPFYIYLQSSVVCFITYGSAVHRSHHYSRLHHRRPKIEQCTLHHHIGTGLLHKTVELME